MTTQPPPAASAAFWQAWRAVNPKAAARPHGVFALADVADVQDALAAI